MKKYILSIDQSTSATKAILFDTDANFIARETIDHKQYYPAPGWVEHDPEEIFQNCCKAIKQVIEKTKIDPADLSHLSITNQRETVVVWNKKTGKPVYNAIVWQCQRGTDICQKLIQDGKTDLVQSKTGLMIDPYFSASGIKWIIENVREAAELAKSGLLACGTIDSWLIYNFTKGNVHATDHSNACRTMLYNIFELKWDTEILKMLGIPVNSLPTVRSSNEKFGQTDIGGILPVSIPISGVMGDSHAALFGQRCFEPGLGKATYGTGSSVMMNIGMKPLKSPKGLVTSIGFSMDNEVHYVFEGNIHCTGDTIKWLTDNLELFENAAESEKIALSVENNGGVYFVPAFAGLGAPYWNNRARAIISGMDRGANKGHIVRAALEAIAYQVKDVIDCMINQSGISLKELRVDGGPTKNKFLMQFQADMLNSSIRISDIEEASALGAALMGSIGMGIYNDLQQIQNISFKGKIKQSQITDIERDNLYSGWKMALKRIE